MSVKTQEWIRRMLPREGAKIAVVGGCGGIGRAVVSAGLDLDLRICVMDLPASVKAHPPAAPDAIEVDATDEAQVKLAFRQLDDLWGGLDGLVFLAGFTLTPPRPTSLISADDWDEVLKGNLKSLHLVTKEALPLLRRSGEASIVTISSTLASSVLPGYAAYAAAKAGVIALTKTLALEAAPHVRVNSVAPSAIATDFMKGGLGRGDSDGNWFDPDALRSLVPLQRLAEVDDVVGPVLFLLSPAASFVNGQTMYVNGGRFMP